MHLVGFIMKIYHDAQSPECQNNILWHSQNPHTVLAGPLHDPKVCVTCAVTARKITAYLHVLRNNKFIYSRSMLG